MRKDRSRGIDGERRHPADLLLDVLVDLTVNKLTEIIKLRGAMMLLRNQNTSVFNLVASVGLSPEDRFKPAEGEKLLANTTI